MVIPYAAGISEDIRHVCRGFKIRIVLKSGPTLRSMLTKVKDTLRCNRYIVSSVAAARSSSGLTKRRLKMRLKEHQGACKRAMMKTSAVVENAWENYHPIHWEETTVLDHAGRQELLVKEACTFR